MKTVLLGNAGAGKSTLSRKLLEIEPAARLSLDELAFSEGSQRRELEDSVADAMQFVAAHASWVVEGCYSDIVEPVLAHANALIFLNPGVDVCVRHCRARPWEPEKFDSPESQHANLENLMDWVREYASREDEYGLHRHRQLFQSFDKVKLELTDPAHYAAALQLYASAPQ
ncbi:shikimate kinase [bacterium]|nr:shikimate kinase [bacterium]